jgi:serine protease Do
VTRFRPSAIRVLLSAIVFFVSITAVSEVTLAQEKPKDAAALESRPVVEQDESQAETGENEKENKKSSTEQDSTHAKEKKKPVPPKPAPLNGVNYIFDTQIILYAEPKMNKIIKSNQALTCTELQSQIADKKCKVTLAKRSTTQRTKPDLYRKASQSVVAILISRKHLDHWHIVLAATGFFISDDGIIATNRHVFNKSDEYMFAMTSDYVVHPIQEVLGANTTNDLAFCRIDSSDYKGLPLRRNIPVGSDISLISHPSGRFYTYSHGVVTRRYMRPPQRGSAKTGDKDGDQGAAVKVPTRWITLSAEFGKGSSGGPVFDRLGNVVGMATSTSNLRVGKKTDTVSQMVFRDCVPAGVLLESLAPEASSP